MFQLQIILMLLVGATSLSTQPNLVEYGQVTRGTFVWIGGTTLSGSLRFVGDPSHAQVYAVDAHGQHYPLLIEQPKVDRVIDTLKVERLAPGLLSQADRQRRDVLTAHVLSLNDSVVAVGYSAESAAQMVAEGLDRSGLIDSVRVVGNQVVYYWRGWKLMSSFTAGPRLKPISLDIQFQRLAEDLINHLNQDEGIVFGWAGSYTVIPRDQVFVCQAEINQIRQSKQAVGNVLTNELVVGPIMLNRPVQDWLNQTMKEE